MKREAWDSPRLPRLFRVRDADQTGFSNKNKCHMTVFSGAGWAQAGGARQPHPCPAPLPRTCASECLYFLPPGSVHTAPRPPSLPPATARRPGRGSADVQGGSLVCLARAVSVWF